MEIKIYKLFFITIFGAIIFMVCNISWHQLNNRIISKEFHYNPYDSNHEINRNFSLYIAAKSLCSDLSTSRGFDQKVIAYSIFGDFHNKKYSIYYDRIEERIKEAAERYDGWIVRLYHNANWKDEFATNMIRKLHCHYPNFDACNITALEVPEQLILLKDQLKLKWENNQVPKKNQRHGMKSLYQIKNFENSSNEIEEIPNFSDILGGKLWRFIPMADETVNVFLSRDLDTPILPREVAAVNEWLENSTALIHVMRDHPNHYTAILGGMWGGKRGKAKKKMTNFFKRILLFPRKVTYGFDQVALRQVLWPHILHDVLVHDSYLCTKRALMPRTKVLPFPTKRSGRYFVGFAQRGPRNKPNGIVPCPLKCRPPNHQDWEFC